jgi:hypothetical protein
MIGRRGTEEGLNWKEAFFLCKGELERQRD